jgi:hypothetical protein
LFGNLKGKAARNAGQGFGAFQLEQRSKQTLRMRIYPELQTRLGFFAVGRGQRVIGKKPCPREKNAIAGAEFSGRFAEPAQDAVRRQHDIGIGGSRELVGPSRKFPCERLLGGGA